jgi:mannose-6-phosphate isomerase-like protein (cupin superfamily)
MREGFSRYDSIKKYITKDGSEIREMLHTQSHGNKKLSVAEARVKPGATTRAHYHQESEEIYVVMAGRGRLRRNKEKIAVESGVSVAIRPGQVHSLENHGDEDLVVLCCCAPAYSHDDTILA